MNMGNLDFVVAEEKVGNYVSQKYFGGKYIYVSDPLETMDVVVLAKAEEALFIEHINLAIGRKP